MQLLASPFAIQISYLIHVILNIVRDEHACEIYLINEIFESLHDKL